VRAFAKEEKACAHTVSSHTKISIQYPVERVVPWSSERRAALALATKPAGALRFITHKLRLKLRAALSHRGRASRRGQARSALAGFSHFKAVLFFRFGIGHCACAFSADA
jgi:hypothetical protein